MNASDVADMTRVLAVGSIGWVVSGSSLEVGITRSRHKGFSGICVTSLYAR
jgi:hypothetical protein